MIFSGMKTGVDVADLRSELFHSMFSPFFLCLLPSHKTRHARVFPREQIRRSGTTSIGWA